MEQIITEKLAANIYQPSPSAPFDVKGTVIKKDGKSVTLAQEIEGHKVEIELRLKDEITQKKGEEAEVKKENIASYRINRPVLGLEGAAEGHDTGDIERILNELGLSPTTDNISLLEHLMRTGILPTKDNVSSYLMSREMLSEIRETLDMESITKLTLEGFDLERESLQKITERIHELKENPEKKSLSELLGFKKDMSTEEAEALSNKLYGTRMGKDYYDAIKCLSKYKEEITKENISKILSTHQKLWELKEAETSEFVSIEMKELDFSIENLYKEFKAYSVGKIGANEKASDFNKMTVMKDDDLSGIKLLLKKIGVEETSETLELARAFALEDFEITKELVGKIQSMKKDFLSLKNALTKEETARIMSMGFDPEKVEIPKLLELISQKNPEENTMTFERPSDFSTLAIPKEGKISYQKLVELIKKGEDFTIETIKSLEKPQNLSPVTVEEKAALKIVRMSEMFERIGEIPKPEVIAEVSKEKEISLAKLYEASKISETRTQKLITKVSETQRTFVEQEYLRMKSKISAQVIRMSIAENVELEVLPLTKANDYIEEKLSVYNNLREMQKGIENSRAVEKMVLPMLYRNGLELNLSEISSIANFLKGNSGIAGAIRDLSNTTEPRFEKSKEKVKALSKKISDELKSGEDFRETYKELINTLKDFSSDGFDEEKEPPFMRTLRRVSNGTTTMQLPIEIDGELNHVNVVIPKTKTKSDISIYLSIETKEQGLTELDLRLVGKNLSLSVKNASDSIVEALPEYEEGLREKGINLFIKN